MQKIEMVGDVRSKGTRPALEPVVDSKSKKSAVAQTKALVKFCHERGLFLLSCGNFDNVIRLQMPLVIGDEHLERGLQIMEEGFSNLYPGKKKSWQKYIRR
ncbi:MAG: aminotransferase class III-fold pyridoxal phosphate-dependent enzyme [Thermodesulfobacteriota bacterium]